jgi:predicted solute-binding protein
MRIDGRDSLILSNRRDVAAISAGAIDALLTSALEFAVIFIAGTVGEGVIPIVRQANWHRS